MLRRFIIRPITATLVFLTPFASGSRTLLYPWMTESAKLFAGTVAYNVFVLFVVEPVLRNWFPPLSPWEHVKGVFGHQRTTYEQIVPIVATSLWIAGNAFIIVMMNRKLHHHKRVRALSGPMTNLVQRSPLSR